MTAKAFLKYRNVWIGCAMLWIVWFHIKLESVGSVLTYAKSIGYGGVDICLFASGLGCWFSLQKDPDAYRFMKRRFARLMPTYLCFIVFWILFRQLTDPIPKIAILGNLLGIQNFTGQGHYFNWYICAVFLLYFLAPFLCGIAEKTESRLQQLAFVILLVLFSVPFWCADTYIVTVSRLAIFYVGILFGKLCSQEALTKRLIAVSLAVLVVGLIVLYLFCAYFHDKLWSYGLYWYPFILITPGLCILISFVMQALDKTKPGRWIIRCLEKIGTFSFEVYLVHILVFDVLQYMTEGSLLPDRPYIWLGSLALIVMLCIGLRRLTDTAQSLLRKITKGGKE